MTEELGELPSTHLATPSHGPSSGFAPLWDELGVPGIERLDVPYVTKDVLRESQSLAALACAVRNTWYFASGVTHAVLSAVHSAFRTDDVIAISRNCHGSVVAAIALLGAELRWLPKEPGQGRTESEGAVSRFLDTNRDVTGIVLSTPSYEGQVIPTESVLRVCRDAGTRIMVDESLGTHWLFGGPFPTTAAHLDCDIVTHSMHKRLGSLVPAGLMHVPYASSLAKREVEASVGLFRSTSPSTPVLASIEFALAQLSDQKCRALAESVFHGAAALRREVGALGFSLSPQEVDPTILHIPHGSADLQCVADALFDAGINYERVDKQGLTLFFSVTMDEGRLEHVRKTLLEALENAPGSRSIPLDYPVPRQCMPPGRVLQMPRVKVPLTDALNRVAAELYANCPPGVPMIVPGELVSEWHLENLPLKDVLVTERTE